MEISKYLKKTTYLMNKYNLKFDYIYDYEEMINFMPTLKNKNTATDIETNSFNFWNGKMISIAFATNQTEATVFSTRHLNDEEIKTIIELYNSNVANSYIYNHYFDRSFTMGKYGEGLKCTHDALLYVHMMYPQRKLNKSGLSLKDVTRDVSKLGDYEEDLVEFKNEYCKENKILMKDFTYDLIPDELLLSYNGFDVISLYDIQEKLFKKFDAFVKNGWTQLPTLLTERHEVSEHYIKAKITGVKIDTEKMNELEVTFRNELLKYQFALENHEDIKKAEKLLIEMAIEKKKAKLKTPIKQIQIDKIINETKFNFNSSTQKRVLFYDILGIPKLYKTKTKNWATGKIIIEVFGEQYELLKYFKQYSIYSKGLTAFLGYNEEDYEEEEIDEEFDEYVEEDEKEVTHTGIKACLDENNIVRANVNLTGTISSRTTTSSPNLA